MQSQQDCRALRNRVLLQDGEGGGMLCAGALKGGGGAGEGVTLQIGRGRHGWLGREGGAGVWGRN